VELVPFPLVDREHQIDLLAEVAVAPVEHRLEGGAAQEEGGLGEPVVVVDEAQ